MGPSKLKRTTFLKRQYFTKSCKNQLTMMRGLVDLYQSDLYYRYDLYKHVICPLLENGALWWLLAAQRASRRLPSRFGIAEVFFNQLWQEQKT